MIDKLFYGAIFLFIIVPLVICSFSAISNWIKYDFKEGIELIKESDTLHGIAIFTRPIWGTALLLFLFACFGVVCLWGEL